MQLQFEQKPLRCLRYALRDVKNFEEVLELRLPDGAGAMVLCVKGRPLIRGKEWRNGRAGVSGGVSVTVFYISDEDQSLHCTDGWLPFQTTWEVPEGERDGTLIVSCLLGGIEARQTGADKVLVTASLSVYAEALLEHTLFLPQLGEVAEDIHMRTGNYPVCVPLEAGEKTLAVDEELILPPGKPEVERICYAALQPGTMEKKLMGDKLVFRGSVQLQLLYVAADGRLNCFEATIPVSQYAQLDNSYGNEGQVHLTVSVTELETEKTEDGRIRLKGGLVGQYVVYDKITVTVAEDAYSNHRVVTPVVASLSFPQVLECKEKQQPLECTIPAMTNQVVCCEAYGHQPSAKRQNDGVVLDAGGKLQVLYYDEEDRLLCATQPWQLTGTEPAAENVMLAAAIELPSPQYTVMQGAVHMRCEFSVTQTAYTEEGITAVVSMEVEEQVSRQGKRPALILCRAGEESLWQMAKSCHSSVAAIRAANGIEDEVLPGKLLLIPVE